MGVFPIVFEGALPGADLVGRVEPVPGMGSAGVVRRGSAVARGAGLESVVPGGLVAVDGRGVDGGALSGPSAGGVVSVPEAGTIGCVDTASGSDVTGSTPPAGTTR